MARPPLNDSLNRSMATCLSIFWRMSKGLDGQESDLFLGKHHSMLPSLGTRPKNKILIVFFLEAKRQRWWIPVRDWTILSWLLFCWFNLHEWWFLQLFSTLRVELHTTQSTTEFLLTLVSKWYHLFVPKKIRQLISELEKAGFENRGGKGSHRNFIHPKLPIPVLISGATGSDALPYQERAVQQALREVSKWKDMLTLIWKW